MTSAHNPPSASEATEAIWSHCGAIDNKSILLAEMCAAPRCSAESVNSTPGLEAPPFSGNERVASGGRRYIRVDRIMTSVDLLICVRAAFRRSRQFRTPRLRS
jgi:hypothetical protein